MIYDLRIIINAFNFIERKIFEEEDILNKIDRERERERDRGFNKSIDILPSIHVKIYESIDISVNS